jgi:hypothetical protein
MKFDLDDLTEEELIELNHAVVHRLRLMRDFKAHDAMMNFGVGDTVMFHPEGREPVIGILVKFNRKSVTVIADNGTRWTVAPSFLKQVPQGMQSKRRNMPLPSPVQLSLIKS